LCQALRYNLGYHIKKWSTEYNKSRQESITPTNNEIICSEFSYLFTNLVNKFVDGIEARCIVTGKEQHLLVGILDKKNNGTYQALSPISAIEVFNKWRVFPT
jgi:hypothetical protein